MTNLRVASSLIKWLQFIESPFETSKTSIKKKNENRSRVSFDYVKQLSKIVPIENHCLARNLLD
jgi:hypothetical protein